MRVLNTELMRGTRRRLTAVQEEWKIRYALDVELKLMAFRSQEPKLEPRRAQGCVKQIPGHGVDKKWTVKDGSEPDVHRRGSVRGTSNGQCEPDDHFRRMLFLQKPGHKRKACRSYASWKAKISEMRGECRDLRKYINNKSFHEVSEARSKPLSLFIEWKVHEGEPFPLFIPPRASLVGNVQCTRNRCCLC